MRDNLRREFSLIVLRLAMALLVLAGAVAHAQESGRSLADQRKSVHNGPSLKARALLAEPALAPRLRGSELEYRYSGRSPYNNAIPVEVYRSGRLQVEMNALDGSVIQLGPEPTEDVATDPSTIADFTPRFGWRELLQTAQEFANKAAPSVDLATLESQVDDKEGLVFFIIDLAFERC